MWQVSIDRPPEARRRPIPTDELNRWLAELDLERGTSPSGRTVAYTYDALTRVSSAVTQGSASYPKWGLSWTYDRYANHTAQSVIAGSAPSNAVNVSATTNRITDPGYSYDANGNLTNDGLNALAYDAENRIVSAAGASYSYDGNSLRAKKVSGGTTTAYVFSGTKVIAEYVNGAAPASPTREYIYSGGALLATLEGGTTKYHHADHLSVRVTSDTGGNVLGQQGHYPFGESWYQGSGGTKWQFTTYKRDAESSNDYAMFRYHVNRLGRFSSPDLLAGSIANPQSLNRYAYVNNDPINLTDPLGLTCGVDAPMCTDYGGGGGGGSPVFCSAAISNCGFTPYGPYGGPNPTTGGGRDPNGGSFGGGVQCTLDGGWAPCGMAWHMLANGSAVACPSGNGCSGTRFDPKTGQLQVLDASYGQVFAGYDCARYGSWPDGSCQAGITVDWMLGWKNVAVTETYYYEAFLRWASDFSAGAGDILSLGTTALVREHLTPAAGVVNLNSGGLLPENWSS